MKPQKYFVDYEEIMTEFSFFFRSTNLLLILFLFPQRLREDARIQRVQTHTHTHTKVADIPADYTSVQVEGVQEILRVLIIKIELSAMELSVKLGASTPRRF